MALMLVSFSTVGAVIAACRPDNAVGWSLLAMLALGLAFFGQVYADYTLVAHPDSLPGGAVAVWLSLWTPVWARPPSSPRPSFACSFPTEGHRQTAGDGWAV